MVATIADVAPIVAPSADQGATVGCFCAHGEQTVKIAAKWLTEPRRGRCGDCIVEKSNY
jgi:hypothetical protein